LKDIAMARVLLADDNADIASFVKEWLELEGYEVTLAVNGAEALELTRSAAPDLILMDVAMPVMDGYEAIRRLRADEATRALPVIALTAHAQADEKGRALEVGATEYESKPIDMPRLLDKIAALLAGRR
jgi:CheY-like chemotaxis protein